MSIQLNNYGQYLGVKDQNFVVYENKKLTKEIPFFKANQIILGSGNSVSTSALLWASIYGIEVVVSSKTGRPLSLMMPLSTDKRVKTRIQQYEAYKTPKGSIIAKAILQSKINSQISLLEKYGLDSKKLNVNFDRIKVEDKTIDEIRTKLHVIEAKCSRQYFKQYFLLFPRYLKPKKREKYRAKTPLNNLLNLGYEVLKGEVYKAILNAHLDPYLGYLHSIQFSKPSLVCDIQEMFRALIENFVLEYHQNLELDSFEERSHRIFLNEKEKLKFILRLNKIFHRRIEYKRRNFSKKSTIQTIIKEETLMIAEFLRGNSTIYSPIFKG